MQRVYRNRTPLSFLFHLKRKQYQFWKRCVLKKTRSRQVFKTLVSLVEIHHYRDEEACWKHTGPSHCMLQLRYTSASIHCKTATLFIFCFIVISALCSQWQRGQGCGSAVVRLLRLLVRVSPKDRYLSVLSVVFCQVEISASGLSLVQSSPTECGVSESDRKASIMSRPWPITSCSTMGAN